jgi:hypothetical protein
MGLIAALNSSVPIDVHSARVVTAARASYFSLRRATSTATDFGFASASLPDQSRPAPLVAPSARPSRSTVTP